MDLIRIGNKTVSRRKIYQVIDKIIDMRRKGISQQDIANRMGIDRSFVSRLESIGEVRKGDSIAFVAFPVKNKEEIMKLLDEYGVNFSLVMTEQERISFVEERSGAELINEIMDLIARARQCDTLVVYASDKRARLIEGLVDCQVIRRDIGESPITQDVYIPIDELRKVLDTILL